MNNTRELLPDIKLRFNIDHPNLEDCYISGYECALAENLEEENPYHEGSLEYEQWQEGWWAGFYGELPIFSQDDDELAPSKLSGQVTANEKAHPFISNLVNSTTLVNILKITGAIAATAVVGYQIIELVA